MFAYVAGSPYVINSKLYALPAEHFGWFFGNQLHLGMIDRAAVSMHAWSAPLRPRDHAEIRDHSSLPQHRW